MPDSNNCFWHLSAVANFTTIRHGFCSIWGENTAFCVYLVHVKYWCAANSNLAYFNELTTTLECQKQLLMSSISNLGCCNAFVILMRFTAFVIWFYTTLRRTEYLVDLWIRINQIAIQNNEIEIAAQTFRLEEVKASLCGAIIEKWLWEERMFLIDASFKIKMINIIS